MTDLTQRTISILIHPNLTEQQRIILLEELHRSSPWHYTPEPTTTTFLTMDPSGTLHLSPYKGLIDAWKPLL